MNEKSLTAAKALRDFQQSPGIGRRDLSTLVPSSMSTVLLILGTFEIITFCVVQVSRINAFLRELHALTLVHLLYLLVEFFYILYDFV